MSNKKGTRKRVFCKTNGKCFYCGCELDINTFHMDHFIPKTKNGKGGENLVPSCPDCNCFKADLSIDEFRDKISQIFNSSIQGKMIPKYFDINISAVKFYYEKIEDGEI